MAIHSSCKTIGVDNLYDRHQREVLMKTKCLYFLIAVTLTFFLGAKHQQKSREGYDFSLRMHVIDIGNGDCIFLQTPNDTIPNNGIYEGYRILIDAGRSNGNSYVIPYLRDLGFEAGDTIDYIIATHAHADHIGGMPEIYDTFQVNNTLDPGFYYGTSATYIEYHDKASSEPNSNFYFNLVDSGLISQNGDSLDFGDELAVRILYTNPDDSMGINNTSIVLWLKYDNISFIFMGDAEGKERTDPPSVTKYVEKYLVDNYDSLELRSTVIKVGHHGSETSSTNALIEAVQSDYAVICEYQELPDTTVIQRWIASGAEILRTDYGDTIYTPGDDNYEIWTDGIEIIVTGCLENSRIANPKNLKVFPNPFTNRLRIEGYSRIKVYNISGRFVAKFKQEWNGKDINGEEVSAGIYFLRFKRENIGKVLKLRRDL
jgi:beta-lactamase superfamily II metal-dependent hydrolase